ncbi:MAG: helix-turn-helix domain-containing protein [Actinobacteria bacterium]|nr:helix-turn-helix domain-containing protein [Actinomycetota bacterium]
MGKEISKNAAPEPEELPYLGLTPNQVVAHNLTRAREWKGWTQDETAEALEPYLGKRWSKASVSQAERSVAGRFIRNFDADEIVALARAFGLPIGWFFMPPAPWSDQLGVPVKLSTPDAKRAGLALAELVDLVFGDEEGQALLSLRLQEWLRQRPAQLSRAQERIRDMVRAKVEAVARETLSELSAWQTTLRTMANHIEDLEVRSRRELAGDLQLDDL